MTTYICTTGTSAAKHLGKRPHELLAWVLEQEGEEQAAGKLFELFRDYLPEDPNLTRELSAEIHSLVRMEISKSDRVLLLASSTPDGYACAKAVELYLKHHWPGITVRTERVEGLQVKDAGLFRTTGVVEFVKRVIQEINAYGADYTVLNPTGGFKALVPYTVLIGMLKSVRCRYIFEQSTELMELPPFPIEFSHSLYQPKRDLFEKIEKETSISKAEYEQNIPFDERRWFDPLIEVVGNEVTLSAIGLLFLDEITRETAKVPFYSVKALEECREIEKDIQGCYPFRYLDRVASDANAFNRDIHIIVGNGLLWLKPGNTTDRYLVSREGWRMLVWRAVREDEVGPQYPTKVQVDPIGERNSHGPFMRVEFYQ